MEEIRLDEVRLKLDAQGLIPAVVQQYNTGDAVAIWELDKSDSTIPPRLLGRGVVARSGENESAVLIHEIYSNNRRIEVGHRVSITHKAQLAQ